MAVPRTDPVPRNPLRAVVSPYTWLATIHLLTDVFVGAVTFTVVVTLLSLSAGLFFVALLGVPVWIATARVTTWLSAFERARFRLTLGAHIPVPALPPHGPMFRYAGRLLVSGAVWRQIGYHLFLLFWGTVTMTLTIAAWSVPIAVMAIPSYWFALPEGSADLWLLRVDDPLSAVAASVLGLVLLVVAAPSIVRALAATDIALARYLLGSMGSEELVERVGKLEESRRRTVDAAEAERRRIERDLHDGAQQRLVALAMTLGRAKSRLAQGGGDDATRELVNEAHSEAKLAITELRTLTQGLHPPVLTDRGLDAALSAVAARSPVPVGVEVDVGVRPSATVEAMAYFVVAEALANVAKHSGARRASVVVRRAGDVLRVVVRDDGMGGADPRGGSGLAGMADRIAGIDGRLYVESPAGGPTTLTVDLPCAS